MLVYRDGVREVCPAELRDELLRTLRQAASGASPSEPLLAALLRAGELECALADAAADSAAAAATLTDAIAEALVGENHRRIAKYTEELFHLELPPAVRVSAPEGFAYYALDPLSYARAVETLNIGQRPVFVIGLRTIGATLSAVVAAAARRRSLAERITVRPTGHPFDRKTEFPHAQRKAIAEAAARHALFLVADEGPGLSGSSLLSVAEALSALGVVPADIVIFCAHKPNPSSLCAPQAAQRWAAFRVVVAGSAAPAPSDATADWSGGLWRNHLYDDHSEWPAAWPQVERLKFASSDAARLYKFEGLGHYGDAPLNRSLAAADAGWSPRVEYAGNGFAAYARIAGDPMSLCDLDAELIARLARYCDFRQREMSVGGAAVEPLRQMLRVNLQEEFGWEYKPEPAEIVRPVIADARLMPHEWLRDRRGRIWKTDVASHGDDHFYPGATDIAWDLAGAIVEWHMSDAAAEALLERYRRLSGDDPGDRLPFFLRAYSAFRLGFCRTAAGACPQERERFTRAAEYYRSCQSPVAKQPGHSIDQSITRSATAPETLAS